MTIESARSTESLKQKKFQKPLIALDDFFLNQEDLVTKGIAQMKTNCADY